MNKIQEHWSFFLLILLIATDLIFCGVEILYSLEYAGNYRYSLTADRGYAEVYGYIKFFWIIIGLLWLALQEYQSIFIVAALLFLYFLIDDAMKVHETVGDDIAEWLDFSATLGLRAKDFGEVIVSASIGLFFILTGFLSYRYSNYFARRIGLYLLIGIFALAFFGIIIDLVHQMVSPEYFWTNTFLVILEDGGELIVVSVICWFVYSLANNKFPLTYSDPELLKR